MPAALLVGMSVAFFAIAGPVFSQRFLNSRPTASSDSLQADTTPTLLNVPSIISDTVSVELAELISQGENILITDSNNHEEKLNAAELFNQENWESASSAYAAASRVDPNDPEAKIYYNNSKARQFGNHLTVAVVVPIKTSSNEAKEVLRGISSAQDEFNRLNNSSNSGLLELVIINDDQQAGKTPELADVIAESPNVLAVLGHEADGPSRQAIARYERSDLAALTPLNIKVHREVSNVDKLSISPISQIDQKESLEIYLEQLSDTLVAHATKKYPSARFSIVYNSDDSYSNDLREKIKQSLEQNQKELFADVDVLNPDFDPQTFATMHNSPENVAFLALSKDKSDVAVSIARTNGENHLNLMGGSELYNPSILITGGEDVNGMVLAVPWSWKKNDPFARQSAAIWKGRVSWRTATAYEATQAIIYALTQAANPTRTQINQMLKAGVPSINNTQVFDDFSQIPLVKVVPGNSGPAGSRHQFEPVESST